MNKTHHRVLIVGAGLIGGSIALDLSAKGVLVSLIDLNPDAINNLISRGVMNNNFTDEEVSVVFISTPPAIAVKSISDCLERYPNAVVIDTISAKMFVVRALEHHPSRSRFLPSHPMAGRAGSGAVNARKEIFADRIWVISSEHTDREFQKTANEILELMNPIILEMSADVHDYSAAAVSHLPQIFASVLAATIFQSKADTSISGGGLKDMVRIAHASPELWQQILIANNQEVLKLLKQAISTLQQFEQDLSFANIEGIENLIRTGDSLVGRLPGKHESVATKYDSISLVVPDQPGSLAKLFDLAQTHSINIEDVRIEHILNKDAAIVELMVKPSISSKTAQVYKENGWLIRE